jgi:transposase-like protein
MTECRDPEKVVREIRRKTRRKFSSEEKIRIVLEGLRGEETIAVLDQVCEKSLRGAARGTRSRIAWMKVRSACPRDNSSACVSPAPSPRNPKCC